MAWTAPRTWVVGEVVTAALMNTHVRDNLLFLGDDHDHSGDSGDGGTIAIESAHSSESGGTAGTTVRNSVTITPLSTGDVIFAFGQLEGQISASTTVDAHIRDNTDGVNGNVMGINNPFGGTVNTRSGMPTARFTSPTVAAHTIQLRDDNGWLTFFEGSLVAFLLPG